MDLRICAENIEIVERTVAFHSVFVGISAKKHVMFYHVFRLSGPNNIGVYDVLSVKKCLQLTL